MAGGVVEVTYDGNDITSNVEVAGAEFNSQLNATPGTFVVTLKDLTRVLDFVTGREFTMSIDGFLLFGGYLTQISRSFAFPAVDTRDISSVKTRLWVLHGVDYNILFDKRVIRDTGNYTRLFPDEADTITTAEVVTKVATDFIDLDGFDVSTYVTGDHPIVGYPYLTPGSTWRQQMDAIQFLDGSLYYITPDKNLVYTQFENTEARWGFSDVPNHRALTGDSGFQGSTWGFRELDLVEDAAQMVNDAFVWGGNEFTNDTGDVIFSRYQASDSIAEHMRLQMAETHFGDSKYASQTLIDQRTRVIVDGSPTGLQPGQAEGEALRGLRFTQWNVKLAWFGNRVPTYGGVPQHLKPGDLVFFYFYTMGIGSSPLILELPLRQLRITYPALDADGGGIVRFEGFFGVQLSDPWTLWRYLMTRQISGNPDTVLNTSNADTTVPVYGSFGQFAPVPEPNGVTRVFNLPNGIGYLANTVQLYLNGILQSAGTGNNDAYQETDPTNGEITMNVAPGPTERLWIVCRTLGS